MVELITTISIVLILDILVTGVLTGVLYLRFRSTQITAVLLAVLFYALDLVASILEIVFVFMNPNDLEMIYLDLNQPFPILFSGLGILSAGMFLLFINYYLREDISYIHVAVIFSIFSSFVTYSFLKLYFGSLGLPFTTPSIPNTPLSFEFLPAIMITYVIIITYPKIIEIARKTEVSKQRYVVVGIGIAMIFYYIITPILITLTSQLDLTGTTAIVTGSTLPRISVAIGDAIILFTYARIPAAYLHDQKIEKLLIISKSGLLVYSQDFVEMNDKTMDEDVLLSGGLSALSSMLAETINVSELESIEFKEKEVLIKQGKVVGYFLITDRPSKFLWNALEKISIVFDVFSDLEITEDQLNTEIPKEPQLVSQVNQVFGV